MKIEEKTLYHYMVDEMAEQLSKKTDGDDEKAFIMLAIDKEGDEFGFSTKIHGSPVLIMRLLLHLFSDKDMKSLLDHTPQLISTILNEDNKKQP